MIVKQLWTESPLRNFNYLVVCPENGEAMAIDPVDHRRCLDVARRNGWEITQVLNTHEHLDHTSGNGAVMKATGARLLAHARAQIDDVDMGLSASDVIRVGRTVELTVMDTPGHTMSHVCLLSRTDTPSLFSGDTLFNAGAGHCKLGGNPHALFRTFAEQIETLADETRVYPGHDYMERNLEFTLSREPGNAQARELARRLAGQDLHDAFVSTIGLERKINSFLRLRQPELVALLREGLPESTGTLPDERVFLLLRELRNRW